MIDPVAGGFLTVGQTAAQRMARHAADRGEAGRTLLVHGPRGAGKSAFVGDLLALLFCAAEDRSRRPCNACRGCRDARSRAHPDLVVGSPEGWRESRHTGESIVAAARRWLLGAAGAPVIGERRIVLIEHADDASEVVQNALLKALEEPGDRHAYILVADDPARLLSTVRSRCRPLRIGPVPRAELVRLLMDGRPPLPEDQASTLATLSNGLAGTALTYAIDPGTLAWRRVVQQELVAMLQKDRSDRFGAIPGLLAEGARFERQKAASAAEAADEGKVAPSAQRAAAIRVVEVWTALARDLMVAAGGRQDLAPSEELAPEIGRLASRIGTEPFAGMVRLLERIHDGLKENAAPRLSLEVAMLAWPRPVR